MIGLVKGPKPIWLNVHGASKTSDYKLAPANSKPSPWRAAEVVAALKLECAKKCMYCECFIDDAAYSAVEHIKPKNFFEELVLEWENLGLACTRCNTNKGGYWSDDPNLQLLNPYVDDLTEHIEFRGPMTVAALSSDRARNTVRKLKLTSREDLLMSRLRRIEDLDSRLRLWNGEEDPAKKILFAEDVEAYMSAVSEFTGVLRAYAATFGFASDL